MAPNAVRLQKMTPNICRKTHEDLLTLFWRSHQKKRLWEKPCRQKSHENVSGKFGEIRAKILRTPKTLPASTPMSEADALINTPRIGPNDN